MVLILGLGFCRKEDPEVWARRLHDEESGRLHIFEAIGHDYLLLLTVAKEVSINHCF